VKLLKEMLENPEMTKDVIVDIVKDLQRQQKRLQDLVNDNIDKEKILQLLLNASDHIQTVRCSCFCRNSRHCGPALTLLANFQMLTAASKKFGIDAHGGDDSDSENGEASDDDKDIRYRDEDDDFAKNFIHPLSKPAPVDSQLASGSSASLRGPSSNPSLSSKPISPTTTTSASSQSKTNASNPFDLWSELMGPANSQPQLQPQPVQPSQPVPPKPKAGPVNWDTFDGPTSFPAPAPAPVTSNRQQVADTFGKYWAGGSQSSPQLQTQQSLQTPMMMAQPSAFYNPQYSSQQPSTQNPYWAAQPASNAGYHPFAQPQASPLAFNPFASPAPVYAHQGNQQQSLQAQHQQAQHQQAQQPQWQANQGQSQQPAAQNNPFW
jgi:hypothetical protein